MSTAPRSRTADRTRVFAERHEIGFGATRMEKDGRGQSKRGGKRATSTPGGKKARAGSRAKG